MVPFRFFSARTWTVLAFAAGVLPLWLSSVEMWDGVVGVHALATGDWATISGWLLDSNWYLTYALFRVADFFHRLGIPAWFFFKLWISVMVVGIAYEIRQLGLKVFDIPEDVAQWLVPLVFSFPVWYVFFSYTPMLGHITCAWLALVGYRLLYARRTSAVACGLVLVAMSFQLASNCVFLVALEAGRWLVREDKARWSYMRSASLLLLSALIFFATRVVWPPVSNYSEYNRFLNPGLFSSWISYFQHFAFFATWLVLLLPILAGVWWRGRHPSGTDFSPRQTTARSWKTVAFFAMLAFACCLPYIAVGLGSPLFVINSYASQSVSAVLANTSTSAALSIWYGGWGARHVLLLTIPIVLFAAWMANTRRVRAKRETDTHTPGRLAVASLLVMIIVNLVIGTAGHWQKLRRIASEHSFVLSLANYPMLPPGKVDLLLDRSTGYLVYMYEANYLLFRAYNTTRWSAQMLPEHPVLEQWGQAQRRLVEGQADKNPTLAAKLNVMDNYSWDISCQTVARVKQPALTVWDVLWRAEHSPEFLPRTELVPVSSTCPDANIFWRRG